VQVASIAPLNLSYLLGIPLNSSYGVLIKFVLTSVGAMRSAKWVPQPSQSGKQFA